MTYISASVIMCCYLCICTVHTQMEQFDKSDNVKKTTEYLDYISNYMQNMSKILADQLPIFLQKLDSTIKIKDDMTLLEIFKNCKNKILKISSTYPETDKECIKIGYEELYDLSKLSKSKQTECYNKVNVFTNSFLKYIRREITKIKKEAMVVTNQLQSCLLIDEEEDVDYKIHQKCIHENMWDCSQFLKNSKDSIEGIIKNGEQLTEETAADILQCYKIVEEKALVDTEDLIEEIKLCINEK